MKYVLTLLLLPAYLIASAQKKQPDRLSWPREIQIEDITVTLYQPQLESFEKDILEGRMALSVKPRKGDLVFGAIWFRARMKTDLDQRLVELEKIDIIRTRFPDTDQEQVDHFARLLEEKIEGSSETMSLDHLLASLEMVKDQQDLSANLKNDPPEIYYRQNSAVLVMIDGDPIFQKTDDNDIEYVVNTPYFLVKDKKSGFHYLRGGKFWYSSKQVTQGWTEIEKVPSTIFKLSEKAMEGYDPGEDSLMMTIDEAPELIVSTRPAELIIVDGQPDYQSIEGTSLLYVNNSESDIIMDINSQEHYVLLAGRWYYSKSLNDGDWKFREPADLPADFGKIPTGSEMAAIRANIPGTEEAEMAVLEQTIPQTATVDRKTATVEVSYDGNPQFARVTGTSVAYAENSDKTVLLVSDKYYCVDDGIWFESTQAQGPWIVSVDRPEEVDDIPPESPVYNVKYVYIYDYTPEVVYVGYTPGYTCSYVYGGVVVYGTGYYYRPWYHTYYYPRPVTYGFNVHYNPWTGWGFSFGFSYGWFSYGWYRPYYSWWGPAGYRYGYRHGYYHGYHHGYYHGYHAGARAGYRAGYQQGQRVASNNVYKKRTDGVRSTGVPRQSIERAQPGTRDRVSTGNNRVTRDQPTRNDRVSQDRSNPSNAVSRDRSRDQIQSRPSTRQNNVYAGRDGNVYRRDQQGNVQQRSQGQWNSTNRSGYQQQINRESQYRQQGAQRYNQYNSNRSYSSGGRSGTRSTGGRTGGGGRRR